MNKNTLYLIGLVVILAVGYMMFFGEKDQTPVEEIAAPEGLTIVLDEVEGSGESGAAMLSEEDGKVKVILSLTGAPEGIMQPAHIHVGECPGVGAVVYPLEFPVSGMSETILDVTLDQLRSEQPLAINVHKSPEEAQIYVSCGELNL